MNDSELIRFEADLVIDGQELVLQYRVVNEGHRDLYLVNRLYRTIPEWELSPNVIYVHLDAEERTIWLNKKTADIPSNVLVNSPIAPFVTPVRTGEVFEETVRLPIPVKDYRQYGKHAGGPSLQALKSEPVEVIYDRAYFTVGYFWRLNGTEEEVRDVRGQDIVIPNAPREAGLPEFGELQSETWQLSVPVLEHREPN